MNQVTSFSPLHYKTRLATSNTSVQQPLLVLLHGYGSNEADLMNLAAYIDPSIHVVSVRAPRSLGPESHAWFALDFTPSGIMWNREEADASLQMLASAIGTIVNETDAAPDRVILGGFSQGAIMALALGLTRPALVRGIAALSGHVPAVAPTDIAIDQLHHMPVFVSHGITDQVLPIQDGRDLRNWLTALPVSLSYHEYDMAHEISGETLRDALAWMTRTLK